MNGFQNITPVEPFEFTLTAAAKSVRYPVTAEFIICLTAQEDFEVLINRGNKAFPIGQNGEYRMPQDDRGTRSRFDFIEFRRKSGASLASNAVTVLIGSGEYRTGLVTLSASVTEKSAATLDCSGADLAIVPAAAAALVLAANGARRCARIRNTSTTNDVRVGSVAADLDAGRGEIILPGESLETFVTGAIYAKSTTGVTLARSEEIY
jgi:hypothetical protein